tara:strand:- start:640 stop:828 length:189 start_codon:yes stop_codon:yes gene_type:complete
MKNLMQYLEQELEETYKFIGDDYQKISNETDCDEDMMRAYDLGRFDTLQRIKRLLNNKKITN